MGTDTRCGWARNPLAEAYHDAEWGVPIHDDRKIFEFIVLEGAQAGLSWDTILRKREAYRRAFDGFDPAKVRRYGARKVAHPLPNPGIGRNRPSGGHLHSSLNACVHWLRRKPGMHQRTHSGSIARAASTLPMSSTSQPKRARIDFTSSFASARFPQMNMVGLVPPKSGFTIRALPTHEKAFTKFARG